MNAQAWAGLAVMVTTEAATLLRVEPFWSWNTPVAWTGFILFADGVVRRRRGASWLTTSPGEFAFLALVSIPLWVVFEWFNLYLRNWNYTGLPQNVALRYVGYAWAFSTISPALFEGAELVAVLRPGSASSQRSAPPAYGFRERTPPAARRWTAGAVLSMAAGALMLISPLVVSPRAAQYLAAPVWLGFIFLLDPINDRLGFASLAADWRARRYDRALNLALSGLLCGILWEFWNFWSRSKWHYTVPIMAHVRIFEMPLPGYLGFPPFALECFVMYVLARGLVSRHLDRTIGL